MNAYLKFIIKALHVGNVMCAVITVHKWVSECSRICIVNIDSYTQFPVCDFWGKCIMHVCNMPVQLNRELRPDISQTAEHSILIMDQNIYIALISHYQSKLSYIVKDLA